jgi:hypothetical protein
MKLLFQDGDFELVLLLQGVKPCLKITNTAVYRKRNLYTRKCVKLGRQVYNFLEDQEL